LGIADIGGSGDSGVGTPAPCFGDKYEEMRYGQQLRAEDDERRETKKQRVM
jgi:hypothetical protein